MKTVLILGREPAAWVALATIIVQAIGAFWAGFSVDTQSVVIAAVAGGVNLVVAFIVHDGVIVAVGGFVQATVALSVGLGAHLNTHEQFAIMTVVVAAAQFFARQQVDAPVSKADLRAAFERPRPDAVSRA